MLGFTDLMPGCWLEVGQENRDYSSRGSAAPTTRHTLYPQKLALNTPTSGGRSVGIVRSRAQATECVCMCVLSAWLASWILQTLWHYAHIMRAKVDEYRTCMSSLHNKQLHHSCKASTYELHYQKMLSPWISTLKWTQRTENMSISCHKNAVQ
jgi:hypothetical protein